MEFVVTGGYSYSELDGLLTYIFSLETLQWREGPSLTAFRSYPVSLPLENTFILVGGNEYFDDFGVETTYHDSILEYAPGTDIWIQRPERLKEPKTCPSANIVGYDLIECSK